MRTKSIKLMVSDEDKRMLDDAAQYLGKSRQAFILENALRTAKEVLLNRTSFILDDRQWEEFNAALDIPPSEEQLQGLQKLLSVKAPWERKN